MVSNSELKRYQKKGEYSYAFGMFPTMEMLENRPDCAEKALLHSSVPEEGKERLCKLCARKGIPVYENDRLVEKLREKENCFVIGVVRKYACELERTASHVVLVNPGDSGNLGTVIRTCVGFGIQNLALVEPAVDIFHPKTIRASMGALFRLNFRYYPSFQEYREKYGAGRDMYPFMLQGSVKLDGLEPMARPFSLIFGNEAAGLDNSFLEVGQSVRIAHSDGIDSLNLSLAAGIGIYHFTKGKF